MFESTARMDPDIQRAYLARLGVEAAPPSVPAMHLLVRRHAERVPYETLWITAGEAWNIDSYEAAARIALHGRGGYCYHMNGGLGLLLSSLGYAVRGHVGGVHGPEGPRASAMGNHLVLTVEGLPSETNPGGVWYVDNGLGDALHDPLPLAAGTHEQPPFVLGLEQDAERSQWHLTHDPGGGFTGMTWTTAQARLADFEAQHEWLSTSPQSPFVQVPMAERRDATGADVMRGLVLSRIGDGARTHEPVPRRAEWFGLLADLFGLRLHALPAETREQLWINVCSAHRRWQESQDSQS
ncbi:arylamine N-acetyltransferase [Streptomyces sp. NPDC085900]|uniref:arylamine N-acetyltransferase n=1 Tax=Streptomyces sp. NPDC085900 TaxID=3365737 RepID=UPI0037D03F53